MKILVTGGAGYIGSMLVPRLLNEDFHVKVVDNFMYGQTSLLDSCHHPKLEIINGDVRDHHLMDVLLKDSDFILPLACLTGAPLCDKRPLDAFSVNFESVDYILRHRSKEQKIIFPTTNSGYGSGTGGEFCTEDSLLRPISLYGKLKVDIEVKILEQGEAITFRLATVFGTSPRMRLDLLVNDFVYRAHFDRALVLFESHYKRNFIHVRDVVEAFLFALKNFSRLKDRPYNVGLNEANLSKLELCQKIQKHVPLFRFVESDSGRDPDQRNYVISNDRINQAGFSARVGLDDGIRELLKGLQIINGRQFRNN